MCGFVIVVVVVVSKALEIVKINEVLRASMDPCL